MVMDSFKHSSDAEHCETRNLPSLSVCEMSFVLRLPKKCSLDLAVSSGLVSSTSSSVDQQAYMKLYEGQCLLTCLPVYVIQSYLIQSISYSDRYSGPAATTEEKLSL